MIITIITNSVQVNDKQGNCLFKKNKNQVGIGIGSNRFKCYIGTDMN